VPEIPAGIDGVLRSVVRQVPDVGEACAFYVEVLGFSLQFRDGDRWAQLSAGDVALALAGPGEAEPGKTGVTLKVRDLQAAVACVVAAGGSVVRPAAVGAHEVRATVIDPAGLLLYVYEPSAT